MAVSPETSVPRIATYLAPSPNIGSAVMCETNVVG